MLKLVTKGDDSIFFGLSILPKDHVEEVHSVSILDIQLDVPVRGLSSKSYRLFIYGSIVEDEEAYSAIVKAVLLLFLCLSGRVLTLSSFPVIYILIDSHIVYIKQPLRTFLS